MLKEVGVKYYILFKENKQKNYAFLINQICY